MSYKKNIQKKAKFQGEFDVDGVKQILGNRVATKIEFAEMHSKLPVKTAIILLGICGCGKTTFARKYVAENPGTEVAEMDMCYKEAVGEMDSPLLNPEALDEKMLDIFDQRLRRYSSRNRSILLDGFWGDMRTRGALIDTLREYGYKICIMYFSLSADKVVDFAIKRAIDFTATDILIKSMPVSLSGTINIFGNNPIEILAKQSQMSEKELSELILNSQACMEQAQKFVDSARREIIMLNPQVATGVIGFGADYIVTYEVE